jgi:hypothetical protein
MAAYAKNDDRPEPSSVAQVATSGEDTHDPFGPEARLDALESGDAWTNKTTGYVPVVQADDSIMWAPGGGGGSVDLSAINQDINVLNGHKIDLRSADYPDSDTEAHATIGWSDDTFGITVRGEPFAPTDLYVVDPQDSGRHVHLSAQAGVSPTIQIQDGANGFILSHNALGGMTLNADLWTLDTRHTVGHGPIIRAPGGDFFRIIVANDGSLSTELVA